MTFKTENSTKVNNKERQNIFEKFSNWEKNTHLRLFKNALKYASFGGALEKKYKKYKQYEKTTKLKINKHDTLLNMLNKNNEIYRIPGRYQKTLEPVSDLVLLRIYLDILELTALHSDNCNQATVKDALSTYRNNFDKSIIDLSKLEFKNASKDKLFVDIYKELYKADSNSLNIFLTETVLMSFIISYYQTKGLSSMQHSNIALKIGDAFIEYSINQLNNSKLNSFLKKIKHGFFKLTEENVNIIIDIIAFMTKYNAEDDDDEDDDDDDDDDDYDNNDKNKVKGKTKGKGKVKYENKNKKKKVKDIAIECFMKKYFSDKKGISSLYYYILLEYMYALIYTAYNAQPEHLMKMAQIYNINSTIKKIEYNNNNIKRSVRMGKLIIDVLIKNDVCSYFIKHEKKKTIGFISLTNGDIILANSAYTDHNKPQLSDKLLPMHALKNVANKASFYTYLTKKQLIIYEKTYNYKKRTVKHKNGNTIVLNDSSHSYTPQIKYSVNHEMLELFLSYIADYTLPRLNNNYPIYVNLIFFISDKKNIPAEHILTFFNLSFNSIRTFLQKYPYTEENQRYHESLYHIICFMLRYSSMGYHEIKEKILGDNVDKKYNGFTDIKDLLNKALQYKFNLVGLLNDAIIYSRFKYWVANSFLDSRGRLYNTESFFNIQNNPTSKMFISLYQDDTHDITMEALRIINKNMVIKSVTGRNFDLTKWHLESKKYFKLKGQGKLKVNEKLAEEKRLKEMLYNENRLEYIKYLYNFFSSSLSKKDFDRFLIRCGYHEKNNKPYTYEKEILTPLNKGGQLKFITLHIKKIRKVWPVLHLIHQLTKNSSIKLLIIEYDFSQSGPIMISILSENISLAIKANLISNVYMDPYTNTLKEYEKLCIKLQEHLCYPFFKDIKRQTFNFKLQKGFLYPFSRNIREQTLCFCEKESYNLLIYNKLLKNNILDIKDILLTLNTCYNLNLSYNVIPEDIKEYYYLIPSSEQKFIKKLIKNSEESFKEFCMFILVIRVTYKLNQIYKKHPWLSLESNFWSKRDLFKKPVMTLYYNATKYRRIIHFKTILREYDQENTSTLPYDTLLYLANNLELFFAKISSQTFDGVNYMKNLTELLTIKEQPIVLRNKYFDIIFKPLIEESIQVPTKTLANKTQKLSINIPTDDLDLQKLTTALSPNIIHSMDAWIVHCFIDKISIINTALKKKKINFAITFATNHDCFSTNFPALTPIILKECVLDLIESKYISNLKNLTKSDHIDLKPYTDALYNSLSLYDQVLHNTNPLFVK